MADGIEPKAWAEAVKAEHEGKPIWLHLADRPAMVTLIRALLAEYLALASPQPHTGRAGVTEEMVDAALASNDGPGGYKLDAVFGFANIVSKEARRAYVRAALNAALTVEPEAPDDWQLIDTAPRDGTVIEITALEDDGTPFEIWPVQWSHIARNELFAPGMVGMWIVPDGSATWREGDGGPTHWRPARGVAP